MTQFEYFIACNNLAKIGNMVKPFKYQEITSLGIFHSNIRTVSLVRGKVLLLKIRQILAQ